MVKKKIWNVKILKKNYKFEWGENHHYLWGAVTFFMGLTIASFIVVVSKFYNVYFFVGCIIVFGLIIQLKYFKNWERLWDKNFRKTQPTKERKNKNV